MKKQDIFDQMQEKWPSPVVVASQVKTMTGGIVSGKTFANLRCKGEPTPESVMVGRRRAYITSSVIDWLRQRTEGGAQHG
ncbi:MAG: hypothetical protein JRG71_05600 [Deltaproteobacteria bacterium]|nr:hypothetical protein [Deltaproteobacteria bacterium]